MSGPKLCYAGGSGSEGKGESSFLRNQEQAHAAQALRSSAAALRYVSLWSCTLFVSISFTLMKRSPKSVLPCLIGFILLPFSWA